MRELAVLPARPGPIWGSEMKQNHLAEEDLAVNLSHGGSGSALRSLWICTIGCKLDEAIPRALVAETISNNLDIANRPNNGKDALQHIFCHGSVEVSLQSTPTLL